MLIPIVSTIFRYPFVEAQYSGQADDQKITTDQDLEDGKGLIWLKAISTTSNNLLHNTERGVTKTLVSNQASIESTSGSNLVSFDKSGFTLDGNSGTNTTGVDSRSFSWLVEQEYFDIVEWTGTGVIDRTVAHNLGVTPELVIVKNMDGNQNWYVFHKDASSVSYPTTNYDNRLYLNSNIATDGNANWWKTSGGQEHDALVISLGNSTTMNLNTDEYIAFIWASKAGESAFGTYTGNATTNNITGLGFSPSKVICKNNDDTSNWYTLFDDNGTVKSTEADNTNAAVDRTTHSTLDTDGFSHLDGFANATGHKYLYMAWR